MPAPSNQIPQRGAQAPGFFSIIPILAKLIWRYGRRLFSVETFVALEKKQGAGSGERTVEEVLLAQALERNKNHFHIADEHLPSHASSAAQTSALRNPVLVVKKGGNNERNG